MRQRKFCFLIFLLTFGIGVLVGAFGRILISSPEASLEIINPVKIETARPEKNCELHGSALHKELVQSSVAQNKKSPLSMEVEFFELQLLNGEKGLVFFIEYGQALKREFPHGYRWEYEKCESYGKRCIEIDVCSECRAKEILWVCNALKEY